MSGKVCCFSGHRVLPQEQREALRPLLERTVRVLIGQGYTRFWTGGAMGFDMMAAQTIVRLKQEFPQLSLSLALPCERHWRRWPQQEKMALCALLEQVEDVVYVSRSYSKLCMLLRNRYLVEQSSACVCFCVRKKSGTGYTMRYAEQCGLSVLNLAELLEQEREEAQLRLF